MEVTQSCLTLCDPIDYPVHGTLQVRRLEWVIPSPGDLPNPGVARRSPTLQVDSLPAEPLGKPNLNGKEIQKRGDRGIHITDLLFCTAETNNTVRQ